MSLVEKAKKKAKEEIEKKKKEADAEANFKDALQKSLTSITRQIMSGLREFHGVKTKHGTLRLVRKQKKPYDKTVGVLRLIRPKNQGTVDLLHITAGIESGTRDYSDDCRNEPYTESVVRIFVKETNRRNDFDWYYHPNPAVWGMGLRDQFGTYTTNWSDGPKKALDEVADWISPLFSAEK